MPLKVLDGILTPVLTALEKLFAGWVAEDRQPAVGLPVGPECSTQRVSGLGEVARALGRTHRQEVLRRIRAECKVERRDAQNRAADPCLLRGNADARPAHTDGI